MRIIRLSLQILYLIKAGLNIWQVDDALAWSQDNFMEFMQCDFIHIHLADTFQQISQNGLIPTLSAAISWPAFSLRYAI